MLCSNGHENPEGATFCSDCGTSLAPDRMVCSNGHENAEGATFCSTCGTALASSPTSQRQSEPTRKMPGRRALVAIGLAMSVLVVGAIVGGVALLGESEEEAETARYVARMRALYPDLEKETVPEIEEQADELCGMIREEGSVEGWVKGMSMDMAITEQTDNLELFASMGNILKGMQIAMPWRCPEFSADAKVYFDSFS